MKNFECKNAKFALIITTTAVTVGLGGCATMGDDSFLSILYGVASIAAGTDGNTEGAARLQTAALAHAAAADGTITNAEAENQVAHQLFQGSPANMAMIASRGTSQSPYPSATSSYPSAGSATASITEQSNTTVASVASSSQSRGKLVSELDPGCVRLIQSRNSTGPVINTLKNYCGQKAIVHYCYRAGGDFPPSPQCDKGWSSSLDLPNGFEYRLSSTSRNPSVQIIGCLGGSRPSLVSGQGTLARYECK